MTINILILHPESWLNNDTPEFYLRSWSKWTYYVQISWSNFRFKFLTKIDVGHGHDQNFGHLTMIHSQKNIHSL